MLSIILPLRIILAVVVILSSAELFAQNAKDANERESNPNREGCFPDEGKYQRNSLMKNSTKLILLVAVMMVTSSLFALQPAPVPTAGDANNRAPNPAREGNAVDGPKSQQEGKYRPLAFGKPKQKVSRSNLSPETSKAYKLMLEGEAYADKANPLAVDKASAQYGVVTKNGTMHFINDIPRIRDIGFPLRENAKQWDVKRKRYCTPADGFGANRTRTDAIKRSAAADLLNLIVCILEMN